MNNHTSSYYGQTCKHFASAFFNNILLFVIKSPGSILSLCLFVFVFTSCGGDTQKPISHEFANPELVTITGYTGDAMEPFISRDGAYLFFNDNATASPEKNIFYATRDTGTYTKFTYVGPIAAVNSTAVDGVPTLDSANKFYYVSMVNYATPNYYSLYFGSWTGSTVTGITASSLAIPGTPLLLYFDLEVSTDGKTMYLSEGDFRPAGAALVASNIVIAVDSGSSFALDANSATIMGNVNTAELEYAAAISANGLELFFTRYVTADSNAEIFQTTRTSTSGTFGVPTRVSAITGFAEGPAFSPDEKSLYYHKLNTISGKFEIYRVTRQ